MASGFSNRNNDRSFSKNDDSRDSGRNRRLSDRSNIDRSNLTYVSNARTRSPGASKTGGNNQLTTNDKSHSPSTTRSNNSRPYVSTTSSLLPGYSYMDRGFPSSSISKEGMSHMPTKDLNIDEFGSMDSDNEEDMPFHQTTKFFERGMPGNVVGDSIDGIPISDSIIYKTGLPSNKNFLQPEASQLRSLHIARTGERDKAFIPRSSADVQYPNDNERALQSFIDALRDPQSLKKNKKALSEDQCMRKHIPSSVRDSSMGVHRGDRTSSDNDIFIRPDSSKHSFSTVKGKFMRPNDSVDIPLSIDERWGTDKSHIRSMSPPASTSFHRQGRWDVNMKASTSDSYRISDDSDARGHLPSSQQLSSSQNLRSENLKKESRSNKSRENTKQSSRLSSRRSNKDKIKSVKLSWHSTPVDRRKGESEPSELGKDTKLNNPLLKCLRQSSKIGLGRARSKDAYQNAVSNVFQTPDDDDDNGNVDCRPLAKSSSNMQVNTDPAILTSTGNQCYAQKPAMGLPTNVAVPQEQPFMNKIQMGLHSDVMVNFDQGFMLNSMTLPGNYALQPDQGFMQDTNMGLSGNIGLHPSTVQSVQGAWMQQEAHMIQNRLMHRMPQPDLHNIQQSAMQGMLPTSMQVIAPSAVNNIPQPYTQSLLNPPTSQSHHLNLQSPNVHNTMLGPSVQGRDQYHMSQPSKYTWGRTDPPATKNQAHTSTSSRPTFQTRPPLTIQNRPPPVIETRPPFIHNEPSSVIQNIPSSNSQNILSPAAQNKPFPPSNTSIPPPATPVIPSQGAQSGPINTTSSSCIDEVMKKLAPDGTGTVKYPAPDTNVLTFDPEIGYRYDPKTGLHYDANSGYFFNSRLKVFLYWDLFTQTYLRVENPTIPFPVLRNQKKSPEREKNAELSGTVINMKKLLEQHRQLKLGYDKVNQDELSRSGGGSSNQSYDRRKRLRESRSPKRQTSPQTSSRSPKNVGRSKSPIPGKKLRRDDDHLMSLLPKRRSISPVSSSRKRDGRHRSGSPGDNRRRPLLRSPQRRRSRSKSPRRLPMTRSPSPERLSRRRNIGNRSRSPDVRRRPLSRSPRKRTCSKSPTGFTKKRSLSPGPSSGRRSNDNRSRSRGNNRARPLSKSPLRRQPRSKDIISVDKELHTGSLIQEATVSGVSPNSKRELGKKTTPTKICLVDSNKKEKGDEIESKSAQASETSSDQTKGVEKNKLPPPKTPNIEKSVHNSKESVSDQNKSFSISKARIDNRMERKSARSQAVGHKESRETSSKRDEGKSKVRRNSSPDRPRSAENRSKTRSDSKSGDGRRNSSNIRKDINSSDKRTEIRGCENSGRNEKQEEDSSINEGRNHRLVGERHFSAAGTRNSSMKQFSFSKDEISQSKTRPSSQFDSFLAVKPKHEENTELMLDVSGVPDDLSDFVVLDGVEDEENSNEEMTEEGLQVLLTEDDVSTDQTRSNKGEGSTGDRPSPSKVCSALKGDHGNEDTLVSNKSARSVLVIQEPSTQIPADKCESEIQQNLVDVKSIEKSVPRSQCAFSEPPSPCCSIYSSYDFSDDENYVTVSVVREEIETEGGDSSPNKFLGDATRRSCVEIEMKEEGALEPAENECANDAKEKTLSDCEIEVRHEVPSSLVEPAETDANEKTLSDSKSEVRDELSSSLVESAETDANEKTLSDSKSEVRDELSSSLAESAETDANEKTLSDSKCEVRDELPSSLVSEEKRNDTAYDNKGSMEKSSPSLNKSIEFPISSLDSLEKRKDTKCNKQESLVGTEPRQKEDDSSNGACELERFEKCGTTGLQVDGKNPELCQSAVEVQHPTVMSQSDQGGMVLTTEPIAAESAQTESQTLVRTNEGGNEENKPAGILGTEIKENKSTVNLETKNGEQSHCSGLSESVKDTQKLENVDKSHDKSVSKGNTSTNVRRDKKLTSVFARLGKPKNFETVSANIVPGDTDPLSRLYNSNPTCFVHVKSPMQGFKDHVIRESVHQHLMKNSIQYLRFSVYHKNYTGIPFECILVSFGSPAQAEKWFLKTNRRITLQVTPKIQADYFLYYSDKPWRCSNCRLPNVFFRSLCYSCFCHKSGSFTSVRFSDFPTKYLGVAKIPASVNESNVLGHLPKTLQQHHVKSVRIVEDPDMHCCAGLVVVEMPSIKIAKNNLNLPSGHVLKYVELDKDPEKKVPGYNQRGARRELDERRSNSSHRPATVSNSKQSQPHGGPSAYEEIGVPHGFQNCERSPRSLEDLNESDRFEGYNSRQGDLHQRSRERSLSPIYLNDHDLSPRQSYENLSPLRTEDLRPNRGSSSRGYDDEYIIHPRVRSRERRSYSPDGVSRTSPHRYSRFSPPHERSPSHRLSPPHRPSPPCRQSPPRRHSPPHRHSPPRRHSPHRRRSPPRRRSSPHPYSSLGGAPPPDGTNNGWRYPPPDVSEFRYEPLSGLHYDPTTTLYYDSRSRLFLNGDVNVYLAYDPEIAMYVRVG